MNPVNPKMPRTTEFSTQPHLSLLRYEQAKNISQDLEKQAARVHEEAKRAGDKAVEIYASVAQLTPVDSEALEVRAGHSVCAGLWLLVLSPTPVPPSLPNTVRVIATLPALQLSWGPAAAVRPLTVKSCFRYVIELIGVESPVSISIKKQGLF